MEKSAQPATSGISAEDLNVEQHPLHTDWVLWFDSPQSKKDSSTWETNLKKVYQFGTVEKFWQLINSIAHASHLKAGSNYHCFREGIEPKWEDPANEGGGKWSLILTQSHNQNIDHLWINLLIGLIGEAFEDTVDVCGAVVSIRTKNNRLAIWTRKACDEAVQKRIGARMYELLELKGIRNLRLQYQAHEDATQSTTTRPSSRYRYPENE
eukprot:TRINITY_DN350_c0_g3_i1.p1 TRINITY_DN350_c0_g3~~TRINITY_DN350_c0_g3_i1.p1  ORF type:complete len:210 (-),score=66.02 TRINITY_DN350_c0_g3_i1:80-709(-)